MTYNPHNPKDRQSMHPEDRRNLVVFFIVCVGLFIVYDMFVQRPYLEEMKRQQELAKQQADNPQPIVSSEQMAQARILSLNEARAETDRISINSETVTGSISLRGARIDDLALNKYFKTTDFVENIQLLAPQKTRFPQYADFGWIAEQGSGIKTPTVTTIWAVQNRTTKITNGESVKLSWDNGQGLIFHREISLDDKYMFKIKDEVVNNSGEDVRLFPYGMISRIDLPEVFTPSPILHEGPIGYLNGELYEPDYDGLVEDEDQINLNAETGWLGITEKYWFAAIIPPQNQTARYNVDQVKMTVGLNERVRFHTDYTGNAQLIKAGESIQHELHFFAGPKIVSMLEDYSASHNIPHFDLAVDFGMFYFMTRPFFTMVTWIGHTTGSFAMAILIFTVLLRIAVFPLANKSFRSFARMRKITPQMIELREKYGEDRQRLQQEIFALYQKEQVNPMAGCLPILIQIPIFFSLYKVLYMSIEMRHTPFWGWIDDMSAMDPTNIFTLFGLIPWDAPSILTIGAWPLIMGLTMVVQQKLNPPAQDPIQQKMMMAMPFVITFVLAKFPAGLVIYWSWSNFLSMIQQYILMRKEGVEVHLFKRSKQEERLEKLVEKGPSGVSPSAEMIEEEIEDLLDGEDEEEQSSKPKKKAAAKKTTTTKNPAAKKKSTGTKKAPAKKKTGIKKPSPKKSLKGK